MTKTFTLYPKQDEHAKVIYRALLSNRAALDTSQTGTGKTVTSSAIAAHLKERGIQVGVVCPLSVVSSWKRTLKAFGVEPLFVSNYEKLRNGADKIVEVKRKRGRHKWFRWMVPKDTLLIFDEVQWCKGHATQNSNLLIAAKQGGHMTLSLSATAAKDPTEMRALGFALGLHELNEMKNNNSFFHWLRSNQCRKDPWNKWILKADADLSGLYGQLFDVDQIAHGMKTSDLPGAFKGQVVLPDLVTVEKASEIYANNNVTLDLLATMLDDIEQQKAMSTTVITDILRARQEVEARKVPIFIEQTEELLDEGKSVIAFFNFRDSIDAFRSSFPDSGIIIGQQRDRDQQLRHWRDDKTRVIAVSAGAGGTGVDLHDQRGEFPRVCLISPGFSVQIYKQVLGRAYRVGMQTDLVQKVLIAADTVEEYVHDRCMAGVNNMETMLG